MLQGRNGSNQDASTAPPIEPYRPGNAVSSRLSRTEAFPAPGRLCGPNRLRSPLLTRRRRTRCAAQPQRLFDIAKVYGGEVVLPPIKKKPATTKSSPPREQKSKASSLGPPGKSTKSVPGFMSLADQEAERLEAIRRKVSGGTSSAPRQGFPARGAVAICSPRAAVGACCGCLAHGCSSKRGVDCPLGRFIERPRRSGRQPLCKLNE